MPPIPPPRAHGFTTTTPVPLYWAEWGPLEAPPLLLLHGGPAASHEYLLPQMLALAEDHRVVTYDQRGGGRSRHDDDRAVIGWRDQVADVGRVSAELRVGRTIVGYPGADCSRCCTRWRRRRDASRRGTGAARAHRSRPDHSVGPPGARGGARPATGKPRRRSIARRAPGVRPSRARPRGVPSARLRGQRGRLLRRPDARPRSHPLPRHRTRAAVYLAITRRLRPRPLARDGARADTGSTRS